MLDWSILYYFATNFIAKIKYSIILIFLVTNKQQEKKINLKNIHIIKNTLKIVLTLS